MGSDLKSHSSTSEKARAEAEALTNTMMRELIRFGDGHQGLCTYPVPDSLWKCFTCIILINLHNHSMEWGLLEFPYNP